MTHAAMFGEARTSDMRERSSADSAETACVGMGKSWPSYCGAVPTPHLVHHLGVFASDFAGSEAFYTAALAALGVQAGYRTEAIAEYWIPEHDAPSLSLETAPTHEDVTRGLHLAFEATNTSAVDAFHRAAVAAGAISRHQPRYWPEYRAYAAFVSDPDGNNVEALVKGA
jgi:catechol 2,3-dioxygenase-like lactoylglutathione lyase family enzyme